MQVLITTCTIRTTQVVKMIFLMRSATKLLSARSLPLFESRASRGHLNTPVHQHTSTHHMSTSLCI